MDLGLYEAKYRFRDMIRRLLPPLRDVDPNTISWSLLPVGVATAAVYFVAASGGPVWLHAVGIGLVFLRMFLGTLDGLVAVEFGKGTGRGEIVNRLAPELCDVMVVGALVLARPDWWLLGVAAMSVAWLTTFAGLVGAVPRAGTQSVGPVGQTDRLAALQVTSLVSLFVGPQPAIDPILVFLGWTVAGGLLTVGLRVHRSLRAAASLRVEAR